MHQKRGSNPNHMLQPLPKQRELWQSPQKAAKAESSHRWGEKPGFGGLGYAPHTHPTIPGPPVLTSAG